MFRRSPSEMGDGDGVGVMMSGGETETREMGLGSENRPDLASGT